MRLLFDESVTKRLAKYLISHEVKTVTAMGWGGTKNGKLLALAATEFDALITVDKNMQYQQNLTTLPLSIIVLNARSNEIEFLVPFVPKLELALLTMVPKSFVSIEL